MAPKIVEGVYRGGRVELDEPMPGVSEGARVRVFFPDPSPAEAEERSRLRAEAFEQMKKGFDFGDAPIRHGTNSMRNGSTDSTGPKTRPHRPTIRRRGKRNDRRRSRE